MSNVKSKILLCNKGTSLIEVLVAIIIMSIGLVGVATMQTTALKNNLSALKRTQASILAYEFIDLMRANIDRSTPSSPVMPSDFESFNSSTSYTITASCLTTAGCTKSQMANTDLANWKLNLANGLSSSATASISGSSGDYVLTITWDDDLTQAAGSQSKSFTTSFTLL